MENNNQNPCSAGIHAPNRHADSSGMLGTGPVLCDETLAHCLADLKRQLELRQAMY